MEPTFNKSFSSSSTATSSRSRASDNASTKKGRDVRVLLSIIILIVAVLGVIAVFGLNFYYDNEIKDIEVVIEDQQDALRTETVERLIEFDQQLKIAKDIIGTRKGYSLLLNTIGGIVVPDVRFSSAKISFNENSTYEIRVRGQALSLNSYLQQIQAIVRSGGIFVNTGFSEYRINANKGENTVSFEFVVPVDRDFIDNELI